MAQDHEKVSSQKCESRASPSKTALHPDSPARENLRLRLAHNAAHAAGDDRDHTSSTTVAVAV